MAGQMCWLPGSSGDTKTLHLREQGHQGWRPYTTFAQYCVPDLQIRGATKGWTTFQKLRSAGWTLVPTAEAHSLKYRQPEIVAPNSAQN
jgi:hypothetical protein